MRFVLGCAFWLLLASAVSAADTLDIYVIDSEGGKAVIVVSPEGETMLVDAGYPTPDDRDTKRVVAAAEALGIKAFDYVVATHYHADHSANIPAVDAKIPGKVFFDHGDPQGTISPQDLKGSYEPYVKAIGNRKRVAVKPGDVIPIKGLKVTVVSSAGEVLKAPLPGAGQANPLAAGVTRQEGRLEENGCSVGLVYEFGKFRMLDLADLLSTIEYGLVCPNNQVGTVDLFMVAHHGYAISNAKFLVHAVRPRAAIMNNGTRKGGEAAVLDILRTSPGMEDIWQLHYTPAAGDKNAPEQFIANPKDPCEGKLVKVVARRDGSFTITNTRNNLSKTYNPK